jgi:hypothetical protein
MNRAEADCEPIVYGGAMHGFTHDVGAEAPGVAHHAATDRRSFAAITAFLFEVFGGSMPGKSLPAARLASGRHTAGAEPAK